MARMDAHGKHTAWREAHIKSLCHALPRSMGSSCMWRNRERLHNIRRLLCSRSDYYPASIYMYNINLRRRSSATTYRSSRHNLTPDPNSHKHHDALKFHVSLNEEVPMTFGCITPDSGQHQPARIPPRLKVESTLISGYKSLSTPAIVRNQSPSSGCQAVVNHRLVIHSTTPNPSSYQQAILFPILPPLNRVCKSTC